MPYVRKDGTITYPKHMVVDDLTFRTDLSRQRKYQIRRRRRGCCVKCGVQLESIGQDANGQNCFREHCPTCRDNTRANRRGFLQGRKQRDRESDPVDTDAEGFVD